MYFHHHISFPSRILPWVACFVLTTGQAQDPAGNALSLADALQMVANSNPALAAQRFEVEAASARINQAAQKPRPTLDLSLENFVGTGALRGVDSLEATMQASQRIERGDKRGKRVALAEHEVEISGATAAVRRSELLSQTARSFVAALSAQQHLELANHALKLAQESQTAVELTVRSGVGSPVESARARAAVATAEVKAMRVRAEQQTALTHLHSMWDADSPLLHEPTGAIALPNQLPDQSQLLAKLSRHPRLALQHALIAGERANLDLQQAQNTGDFTLRGGVRFMGDSDDAAFVAGVSVPLPSRNFNRGNIRAARAELSGAEQTVRTIEVELRATFDTTWQDLESNYGAALALQQQALPALIEALDVIRSAHEQGQLPYAEVLTARQQLAELRHDILSYESAFAANLVQIDALTDPTFPLTQALLHFR